MLFMILRKLCYACDLIDDPVLIAEYKKYHKAVWPEIVKSIKKSGIQVMEIYIIANRLFMIMEVDKTFNLQRKQEMDAANLKVQEWEKLMWNYQKSLPLAEEGEKWILMERIYKLE